MACPSPYSETKRYDKLKEMQNEQLKFISYKKWHWNLGQKLRISASQSWLTAFSTVCLHKVVKQMRRQWVCCRYLRIGGLYTATMLVFWIGAIMKRINGSIIVILEFKWPVSWYEFLRLLINLGLKRNFNQTLVDWQFPIQLSFFFPQRYLFMLFVFVCLFVVVFFVVVFFLLFIIILLNLLSCTYNEPTIYFQDFSQSHIDVRLIGSSRGPNNVYVYINHIRT